MRDPADLWERLEGSRQPIEKTAEIANAHFLAVRRYEGDVGLKAQAQWGGRDGVEFSAGLTGQIRDNEGNFAEIQAQQYDNGRGEASLQTGHRFQFESDAKTKREEHPKQ